MNKFKYLIADINEGEISGTNDESVAIDFSLSEDYFVLDTESGEWLQATGNRVPIEDINAEA